MDAEVSRASRSVAPAGGQAGHAVPGSGPRPAQDAPRRLGGQRQGAGTARGCRQLEPQDKLRRLAPVDVVLTIQSLKLRANYPRIITPVHTRQSRNAHVSLNYNSLEQRFQQTRALTCGQVACHQKNAGVVRLARARRARRGPVRAHRREREGRAP